MSSRPRANRPQDYRCSGLRSLKEKGVQLTSAIKGLGNQESHARVFGSHVGAAL